MGLLLLGWTSSPTGDERPETQRGKKGMKGRMVGTRPNALAARDARDGDFLEDGPKGKAVKACRKRWAWRDHGEVTEPFSPLEGKRR